MLRALAGPLRRVAAVAGRARSIVFAQAIVTEEHRIEPFDPDGGRSFTAPVGRALWLREPHRVVSVFARCRLQLGTICAKKKDDANSDWRRKMTHAEPQRERIMRISAALFAKKGYQSVGVAELGELVGLGRGALYYHIRSKEELLFDIITKYISELVATGSRILDTTMDPCSRIRALSRHMMSVIAANRAEMTVCFREADSLSGARHTMVAQLHSDYQALWSRTCDEGYRDGAFRKLPPVALKGLLGMYFHSFLWLDPRGSSSADEIAGIFSDIVLRALAPDVACEEEQPVRQSRRGR